MANPKGNVQSDQPRLRERHSSYCCAIYTLYWASQGFQVLSRLAGALVLCKHIMQHV